MSDFIHFFHDLIHVYSPRAGVRQPPGNKVLMSTEMSCHFTHFTFCKFQKMSLMSDFIYFLYDLIHVYSPEAGPDSPRGQNFDVNRKAISLYSFVANFKEITLMSDFIHFHDLIHVYSPRAGGIQPLGDKVKR